MKNRRELFRYAQLLLGSAILAFGLFNVHSQSRITEGGVLGTTLLLQHWFGISPSISEAVLDVCCYLLGLKYLGKSFLRYALTATGGFALSYALFERMGYMLPSMLDQPLLAAVVGGLFVGVGVGLVVRVGGAAGGDDKLGRERRRVNHQRVIAGHRQGIIQPLKHPFAVMLDKRGFAMHDLGRPHDSRAKRLGDRLVPETDAQ